MSRPPKVHYDADGHARCHRPGATILTADRDAVTCSQCTAILAGTWGNYPHQSGYQWADVKPHGTPAAARRHYRRGEKPLRRYCETCAQAQERDTADRYARRAA
jgi:hypothetical protein